MPYIVSTEHHDFFAKNGFIEFESLFSSDLLQNIPIDLDSKQLFISGHDLLRKNEKLFKLIFSRNFVDVLSALFRIKTPRLAYDQLWLSTDTTPTQNTKPLRFEEASCVGPLSGVIAIALTDIQEDKRLDVPLPKKAGDVMFFTPKLAVSFSSIFDHPSQALLVIGIGDHRLFYRHVASDPFVHALKKEGFVFGDLLTSKTHPFLKKSS